MASRSDASIATPADASIATPADASIATPADAGSVPPTDAAPFVPTEKIVSAGLWDFYCGLKAGRLQCWSDLELWTNMFAPVVANAPPDLVDIFMSETMDSDPVLCGIDVRGKGTCWGPGKTLDVGEGVKSIGISRYGTCTVKADGALACTGNLIPPPPDRRYVQIVGWADFSLGIDDPACRCMRSAALTSSPRRPGTCGSR